MANLGVDLEGEVVMDLVERLRAYAKFGDPTTSLFNEAADTLLALQTQLEQLKSDDDHLAEVPSPHGAMSTEGGADVDTLEWIWHMDLHLTEHDIVHAGKALRAAWPSVRTYLFNVENERDTWRELARNSDANYQKTVALQAQVDRYTRISESGESLGGEYEERERRIAAEAQLERVERERPKRRWLNEAIWFLGLTKEINAPVSPYGTAGEMIEHIISKAIELEQRALPSAKTAQTTETEQQKG